MKYNISIADSLLKQRFKPPRGTAGLDTKVWAGGSWELKEYWGDTRVYIWQEFAQHFFCLQKKKKKNWIWKPLLKNLGTIPDVSFLLDRGDTKNFSWQERGNKEKVNISIICKTIVSYYS